MPEVVVIKMDPARTEKWRYSGKVTGRENTRVEIEAYFNRDDLPFHGITFARGDRFLETYYSDRWYNIFEIHDWRDDHIKGWYCNITRPAEIDGSQIAYVDLALDLLVYPEGHMLVLDEDEFAALDLPEWERKQALGALEELKTRFTDLFKA